MADIEINITKDIENKLLERREIVFTASYVGKTPSKEELKESVCKKLNLNPDTTSIVKIEQRYGSMRSEVMVHSYSEKEAMERFSKKRGKKGGAEKKAGAGVASETAAKPETASKEDSKK